MVTAQSLSGAAISALGSGSGGGGGGGGSGPASCATRGIRLAGGPLGLFVGTVLLW